MPLFLVVYHSQSGANAKLARAAYDAAQHCDGLEVVVSRADAVSSEQILRARSVLFCFSEMNGAICGGMKALLDRSFYPLVKANKVLSIGAAMSVGNDGQAALQSFRRIHQGLGSRWVSETIIVKGEPDQYAIHDVGQLARAMAEGTAMGIF